MPSKADCIKAVEATGLAPERAAALVDFVMREQRALKAAGQVVNLEGELARALRSAAEQERLSLLRERRNTALTIVKRRRLEENTARLQAEGLDFQRAITSLLIGENPPGGTEFAAANSVPPGKVNNRPKWPSAARRMDALRAKWSSELTRALDAVPGLGEAIRKDTAFDATVRREMIEPGSTGDATARQAAGILGNILEDVRQTLNDAGANIGRLEGYAPQNHSADKLLKGGQSAWVARMLDDLDWTRTMPDVPAERRPEVLSELWRTIVTGQRPVAREAMDNPFRRPRNLASAFEHERTLHFKDSQTAAAYHAEFGEGTVLDAVLSRIARGSRRAGLMDAFGPNPETMLESLYSNEAARLRNLTPDEVRALATEKTAKRLERLEKRIARGDDAARQAWDRQVTALQAELIADVGQFRVGDRKGFVGMALKTLLGETSPETPRRATVAKWMRNIRFVNSLSSLGSAVLAAIGDIQTKSLWYRHGGENVFESIHQAFRMNLEGLQSAEKKEIGRALGFYTDKFLDAFHARFTEGDAAPGWLARNVNNLFRISGLNAWTEGQKAAAGFYLAKRMAENAGKSFDQLDVHYAATLRRAGLEDRWDVIRQLAAKEVDGHGYVLPESARELTDAQLEAHMPENLRQDMRPSDPERAENFDAARAREQHRLREKLELDLLGYIHDEVGYAVIEPDAKTRAAMTWGGLNAGTAGGEMARAVMQFKSFPVAYMQRILMEQRWLRAADESSFTTHAGGMIFSAAVCAVMGYISLTARDLTRGRELRDPLNINTVAASIVQGGGLSIWGDFFLGKYNRWGGDMLSSAAGPTLSMLGEGVMAVNLAGKGDVEHGRDKLIRLGVAKMPYANLWWAKSALDYGMFFHLREWMSPGTLARSERALKRDFNQRYLKIGGLDLAPSKHIKRGGGFR